MCNRGQKLKLLHRLVAVAFVKNPHGKPEVNHKDGCKFNCQPSNLEWVTPKENGQHAAALGLKARGSGIALAKLNEDKVKIIKRRIAKGDTIKHISKDYKIHSSQIYRIRSGDLWKHV